VDLLLLLQESEYEDLLDFDVESEDEEPEDLLDLEDGELLFPLFEELLFPPSPLSPRRLEDLELLVELGEE